MRIAFIGKGGSGKTTVSSSFIRWLAASQFVVAVDADVNSHLADALEMESCASTLIPRVAEIFDVLEPSRAEFIDALGERPVIGCLPLAETSVLIECSPADSFLRNFATIKGNIALLTAGTYTEDDVGKACYHAKLFGTQLIAHRLNDRVTDTVVFDVTAGTDPVATSLILAYDLHIVVVEPTLKSIQVYRDYLHATESVRRGPVLVVANKIRSDGDLEFIQQHVPRSSILGSIGCSQALKRAEQGEEGAASGFVADNAAIFKAIDQVLRAQPQRRSEYREAITRWFKAYSAKWYDALYGQEIGKISIGTQVDSAI